MSQQFKENNNQHASDKAFQCYFNILIMSTNKNKQNTTVVIWIQKILYNKLVSLLH